MIWEELLKGLAIFVSMAIITLIVVFILDSVFNFIGSQHTESTSKSFSKKTLPKRAQQIRKRLLAGKTLRNLS